MTGENKKRFEEWYLVDYRSYKDTRSKDIFKIRELTWFYEQPHEMQKGVIEAYYDSVGLIIVVDVFDSKEEYCWYILQEDIVSPFFKSAQCDIIELPKSRKEATLEAFKEADILANKTL
jgi:hypothetical protein